MRFLALAPKAQAYYQGLEQRRLNPRHQVAKILALSDIYGIEATAQAIEDAIAFEAFHCDYIANLLESRARLLPQPSALHLTRRQDLLDFELDQPDLALYESHDHET